MTINKNIAFPYGFLPRLPPTASDLKVHRSTFNVHRSLPSLLLCLSQISQISQRTHRILAFAIRMVRSPFNLQRSTFSTLSTSFPHTDLTNLTDGCIAIARNLPALLPSAFRPEVHTSDSACASVRFVRFV